jgi:hypothetical protein
VNPHKEFNLIFRGEVANQYNANDVRKKLSVIFKISDEKVDRLFSGSPFVIKKNITKADALLLQQKLFAIGAVTYIEPVQLEGLSAAVHAHKSTPTHTSKPKPVNTHYAASTIAPLAAPVVTPVAPQSTSQSAPVLEQDFDNDTADAPRGFGITATQIIPLGMVILAVVLLIAYFPWPSMIFKKGFAIGLLLLFLGIRKLRH